MPASATTTTCLHTAIESIRAHLKQREQSGGGAKALPEGTRKRIVKQLQEADQVEVETWRSLILSMIHEHLVRNQEARIFVAARSLSGEGDGNARKTCLAGVSKKDGEASAVKLLGAGAYGEVYAVEGRAVKVTSLDDMWYGLKECLESWASEVKFARLCGSQGVGPVVHDAFICEHGLKQYGVIVMDMIEDGVTLYEWRKTASEARVQAAEALLRKKLAKVHASGLIHGDLHSNNVMVVSDKKRGTVKDVLILDYGRTVSMTLLQKFDVDSVAVKNGFGRLIDTVLLHLVSSKVISVGC